MNQQSVRAFLACPVLNQSAVLTVADEAREKAEPWAVTVYNAADPALAYACDVRAFADESEARKRLAAIVRAWDG